MTSLDFMDQHPVLTVVLGFLALLAVEVVVVNVANAVVAMARRGR